MKIEEYSTTTVYLYICNRFYSTLYASISTLYKVAHQEVWFIFFCEFLFEDFKKNWNSIFQDDRVYWARVELYNLKTDVQLLDEFGVLKLEFFKELIMSASELYNKIFDTY